MAKFWVALRHDANPLPIPTGLYQDQRWDWTYELNWGSYTVEEMLNVTQGRKVTHLKTNGKIPVELVRKWAKNITHLRLRDPSASDMKETLQIFSKLDNLKALDLGDNQYEAGLPDCVCTVTSLTELNLVACGLVDLPKKLSELKNLEALNLWASNFSKGLPECIRHLQNLKELKLSRCCLSESSYDVLCQAFTQLAENKKLETLDLCGNNLSCGLPVQICSLKNLKVLDLTSCSLPSDLGLGNYTLRFLYLRKLERLYLSGNIFSGYGLPDAICKLEALQELDIANCSLSDIPKSIASRQTLTTLRAGGNNFQKGLPSVITKLKSLKYLNVSNCRLDSLPQQMDELINLEELDIGGELNIFDIFPSVIASLKRLRKLNLTGLLKLKSLDSNIVQLEHLATIQCTACDSLKSPPLAVCYQGINAIKKYYSDLTTIPDERIAVISAAVIGNRMAGKTSLVRSLKNKKRVLAYRNNSLVIDDATEVFEIEELDLGRFKLRLFDLGGHNAYHIAYQLTIRGNYVPIVVVNMEEYDHLASERDTKEAARRLCMQYLSHLYLPCPKLGPPILVLTHKDRLHTEQYRTRKGQLLEAMETLKRDMLIEEKRYHGGKSNFCKIEHFSNEENPLFHPDDIFDFGSDLDEVSNIQALVAMLDQRCGNHVEIIPAIWKLLEDYFEEHKEKPFIPLSDILKEFPADTNLVVLRYMHNIGRVLWFEKSLPDLVFHRMPVITSVIAALFHHQSKERWKSRIESFQPFYYQSQWMSREKFSALVNQFLATGVMDGAVLFYLYDQMDFPPDSAITLLRIFHLICGPIQSSPRETFLIPHLSPDPITSGTVDGKLLPVRADIIFIGLDPPLYVYPVLTATYLNLFTEHGFKIRTAGNGAMVHHGETVGRFIHDETRRRITVQVDTTVSELDDSWRRLLNVIKNVLQNLATVWVAARPICEFFCSHCLYIKEPAPDSEVDPNWFASLHNPVTSAGENALFKFEGVHPVPCCNDKTNGGPLKVPKPLRYPCLHLSAEEKDKVQSYLTQLDLPTAQEAQESQTGNLSTTANSVTTPNLSTVVDSASINEMVMMMKSLPVLLNEKPSLPTRPHAVMGCASESQYAMTPTKGRALIISNKFEVMDSATGQMFWRRGAEHDYENMRMMLSQFGFVTSGNHQNYTAKDIVETIHTETQLMNSNTRESVHRDLGMFVLVLSSHGNEGCITGSDYLRVKLTDIYNLLSPRNFPAMQGKPKLIIIQSCSGDNVEMMLDSDTPGDPDPLTVTSLHQRNTNSNPPNTALPIEDLDNDDRHESISVADLLIMQSSFDTFASPRSPILGSSFIRAIVLAFNNYAEQHHVEAIAEIVSSGPSFLVAGDPKDRKITVREIVSRYSAEKTVEYLRTCSPADRQKAYIAQMPKTTCTFTQLRKLFLHPSLGMHTPYNHPDTVLHPVLPSTKDTELTWLPDLLTEWTTNGTRTWAKYIQWKVHKT